MSYLSKVSRTSISIRRARFANGRGRGFRPRPSGRRPPRGTDGRLYPWGKEEIPRLANVGDNPTIRPRRLLKAETVLGISPYGALNMTGNAWEYVDETITPEARSIDLFKNIPCSRQSKWVAIRGGSYDPQNKLADFKIYEFMAVPECYAGRNYGIRCVKTQ